MSAPVHARVLRYDGHAYSSGWTGKRVYSDPQKTRDGQVMLVCGVGLDDVFRESRFMGWVDLKSKGSRDARLVTCGCCASRLRQVGFKHAPRPNPPVIIGPNLVDGEGGGR